MKSKSNIITVLVLVAILVVVGVFTLGDDSNGGAEGESSDIAKVQKGDALPYTDMDGNPVDLSDYAGKPLVINAWASWCPFCVRELPDFTELKKEFGDDIEVIAINRRESQVKARAFLDSIGNPEGIIFLLDNKDDFYRSIGGFSMPETIFYDKDGNIAVHKRGFMALEEMKQHVETALAVN